MHTRAKSAYSPSDSSGWQANAVGVDTLVGGIRNEELWTLIRRFNKVLCPGTFPR